MGIQERKQREREQRREDILDASKALIMKRGAAAVTMADIAEATELSKAALYLYFQSKEHLLTVILVDATHKFADFVEQKLQEVRSGRDQITVIARCFLDFYRESEDLFVFSGITTNNPLVAGGLERVEDPEGGTLWGRFEEIIRRCCENGVRDGSFDPELDIPQTVRSTMLIFTAMVERLTAIPVERRDRAMVVREIVGVCSILRAALINKNAGQAEFVRELMSQT